MPRRPRDSTDPVAHHGFLDGVDDKEQDKRKRRRSREEEDDEIDLDHIL